MGEPSGLAAQGNSGRVGEKEGRMGGFQGVHAFIHMQVTYRVQVWRG